MTKKTSKHSSGGNSGKGVRHAPRSKKKNEVSSDRTLQSSLTSNVGLAPRSDEDASFTAGQSGDLQGISNLAEADPESVEELLEDGQALEAEIVEGVEDARDEKEVPSRGRLDPDAEPHPFDDRNKI
jgi:hypothetical protein